MLLLVKVPGLFRKPVLSRLLGSQGQSVPDADGESPPKLRWPRSQAGPMVSKRPLRPRYGHKANYGACQTDYQPKELTHPSPRTSLTIVDSGSEVLEIIAIMLKYQTLIIYKLLAKKGCEAGGNDLWLYQGPTLALTPCRGLASGAHC